MRSRRHALLRLAGLAAAAAFATGAAAATAATAGAYEQCLQKAATTLATADCNAVELRRVTRLHDDAYRRLTAALSADRRRLLVASQRRWVAFRDAECDLAASQAAGGTLEPILAVACTIRLTVDRTAQLKRHLRP